MYGQYPTLFPQSSNREDFTRTVAVFDDDTGQPINLSGITFLKPPNGFTGINWQVTDGQVVTPSVTSITVPGYPVGNQLSALNLIVGLNLFINAGDPITITDVGGNATMIGYVMSYAPATGALVVQIGLQFLLQIWSQDHWGRGFGEDYSQWYDWGGSSPGGPVPIIQATLGNGLTIIDMGFVQINIPALTMHRLQTKSYAIAMAMTDGVNTRQIFIGKLPILSGGMMQMTAIAVATTSAGAPKPPPAQSTQSDNIPAGVP